MDKRPYIKTKPRYKRREEPDPSKPTKGMQATREKMEKVSKNKQKQPLSTNKPKKRTSSDSFPQQESPSHPNTTVFINNKT